VKLILEDVHGNLKAADSYLFGKRITVVTGSWYDNRVSFTELHSFFTQALGPTLDIDTEQVLYPRPKQIWTYQLDHKHGQHRFFVKDRKCLDWFLLKYSDVLTRWS